MHGGVVGKTAKGPPGKVAPKTTTSTFTVALDPTKPKAKATAFKVPGTVVTAQDIPDTPGAPPTAAPGSTTTRFTVALDPTKPKPKATAFKVPGTVVTAEDIPDTPGAAAQGSANALNEEAGGMVTANPNAGPGEVGYVDPNAAPGQPGYMDPETGLVVPPASYASSRNSTYSSNSNLGIPHTTSMIPSRDLPDAFPITVPLDGVSIEVGEFSVEEIEHVNDGTMYIGCTETDAGQRVCATAAGGKYDRQKAEETIIAKLRAADTGGSSAMNPNATIDDITQLAMKAVSNVQIQLNNTASVINKETAGYTVGCNSITNPAVKAECQNNATKMASLSASVRGAAAQAQKIGLRTARGGSRRRRKARRGSSKDRRR